MGGLDTELVSPSVTGMNPFEALALAVGAGAIDALAHYDRDALTTAGVKPDTLREWARIHTTYYGPTRYRTQQRRALTLARDNGTSLDKLVFIEKHLTRFTGTEQWKLRHALLSVRGTYETLRRRANDILPTAEPQPAKKQMTFSAPKHGRTRITITADDRRAADLEHALRHHIDPTQPAAPQMEAAFWNLIDAGETVPAAAPRPMILVPLPEYTRITAGLGDDVILTLTDGTTMTGAEFLASEFGDTLDVAAFHPEAGAVNLYRTQRLANTKQRDLARLVMPVCAFPGCRHGAQTCEIHHVTAWKHGGETNLDNLAPLCRYHNRVNDDDPSRNKRGHITMIRGAPWWISPHGTPVKNSNRGAIDQLFG